MAKAAKKTAKKSAKKTAKKAAKKTAKKVTKKAPAKAAKKTAKKVTKKAAKKATKKTATKAEKKTAKKVAKKTTKKKTRKSAKKQEINPELGKTGVTVQLGGSKPALALAPGVMLSRKKNKKNAATETDSVRRRRMSSKEIAKIKDKLMEKRDQLIHGMRRELADYRARSEHKSSDEADMATDAYDEDLSFEITATSEKELEQIENALDRIADGSYGRCEHCDTVISPSRLRILPFAAACKVCMREKESMEKRGESTANWNIIGKDEAKD